MNETQELRQNGINLSDLMFFCLERWRWIVACMLIVAVLAGAYKYQATVKENQYRKSKGIVAEEKSDESDGQLDDLKDQSDALSTSIGFYEQALQEMECDLEKQQDYLEHSVVMQLDPYHVPTGILSYYVEGEEHTDTLIAAYSTFISSGKLAEELYDIDSKIPVEDWRYLITFGGSTNEKYEIKNNSIISKVTDAIFQVQIRMPDSTSGEAYLNRVEEVMMEYSSQLRTNLVEHKLMLLDSVQSEISDPDMQEYQSTMRSEYTSSVKNLQALRTEFETLLESLQESQEGASSVQVEKETPVALVNPVSAALKFAAFGLALGICMACFFLLVFYIIGGRLQDTEAFSLEFGMPLLGVVRVPETQMRLFGFIDTWIFRLRGEYYSRISFEEQVKIATANIQTAISKNFDFSDKGMKKIMLSGTIAEKDVSTLCTQLLTEIQEVFLSTYMQIVFQSAALEELENYDGVLFIEKRGTSASRLISQEKKLALDRKVKVLGTIVVC